MATIHRGILVGFNTKQITQMTRTSMLLPEPHEGETTLSFFCIRIENKSLFFRTLLLQLKKTFNHTKYIVGLSNITQLR